MANNNNNNNQFRLRQFGQGIAIRFLARFILLPADMFIEFIIDNYIRPYFGKNEAANKNASHDGNCTTQLFR